MKKIGLFIILLGFYLNLSFAQEGVLLNYSPAAGQSYITAYDMHTIIEQEIMGIDQQLEMNMIMITHTTVKEIREETVVLSMNYQRLAIESLTPAVNVVIDTKSDEYQPGLQYLRPMLGKNFEVIIDKQGSVKEVRGLDVIIKGIINETDSDNPAAMPYENTLSDAFGAENIKNNFEYIMPLYPAYKVKNGDQWSYSRTNSAAQFEFNINNVSTVKNITSNNVIIQTTSSINTPENTRLKIEGMDAKVNLKGRQMGEINIDPRTGIVKNGTIKQNIEGNLWLDMTDQGVGNLKVPMKIITDIDVSVEFD